MTELHGLVPSLYDADLLPAGLPPIRQHAGRLQIYARDLTEFSAYIPSHGDCFLIVLPDMTTILLDAALDTSVRGITEWLHALGVEERIDCFICSHHHRDHVGGVEGLLKSFTFGRVLGANWSPEIGMGFQSPSYPVALEAAGLRAERLRAGDVLEMGGVRLEVLWPLPDSDLTPAGQQEALSSGRLGVMQNVYSLVFRLVYRGFAALFTGDIHREAEGEILRRFGPAYVRCDFLKFPHHGVTGTSGGKEFLQAAGAQVSLCMREYLFPSDWEHLRRYAARYNYASYLHGAFGLITDGSVMTFAAASEEPVTLPVCAMQERSDPMLKMSFLNQFPACPAPYVHGDTTLIRFPDGKVMLIDCGLDMTYYLTLQWLRAHGVTGHIDYFVATHYHGDHVGIFRELVETGYTFGQVITTGWGRNNCNVDPDFFEGLRRAALEETVLRAGDSFQVSGVRFDVLWPPPDAPESLELDADPAILNTYGLMLKATYGSFTALFAADVLEPGEKGVLALYRDKLPSAFLKAGHHGNDDANCQEFLEAVSPTVSLAFGRWVYGKNATGRLRSLVKRHFIVGEDGDVELVTNGRTFTVSSEKVPPMTFNL